MVLAIVVAWYANISEMPGMWEARCEGEPPPPPPLPRPALMLDCRADGTIQSIGSASLLPYRRAPCIHLAGCQRVPTQAGAPASQ